ncbi:MAG: hypothetical protein AAGF78_02155 [Pseudomonadota bacterium]
MFRLIRLVVLVALAFAAGVQFERADAATSCAEEADWGPYLECVGRTILAEVIG